MRIRKEEIRFDENNRALDCHLLVTYRKAHRIASCGQARQTKEGALRPPRVSALAGLATAALALDALAIHALATGTQGLAGIDGHGVLRKNAAELPRNQG